LASTASLNEEASLMEVRPREKRKCFCMLITVIAKLDGFVGICKPPLNLPRKGDFKNCFFKSSLPGRVWVGL
jgi:hypothetical protein